MAESIDKKQLKELTTEASKASEAINKLQKEIGSMFSPNSQYTYAKIHSVRKYTYTG